MDLLNSHIVPSNQTVRLTDYLVGVFEELPSRKAVKKAISKKRIKLNGVTASTAIYPKQGDKIDLFAEEQTHPEYKLNIEVVFENNDFAVVNKPAGLKISGNEHQNLQNCLSYNLQKSTSKEALLYPRPAHRLDKSTSGLVLIAKTYTYLRHFLDLFEKKKINKTYNAIVEGAISSQGIIDEAIDGKQSESSYELIQNFDSVKNGSLSLVRLLPHTGRQHQLRKHMAFIGHPIVGDTLYNEEGKLKHKGLFLVASKLSLKLPNGESFEVQIPLPKKFNSLIDRERRWVERIEEKKKLKDFVATSDLIQDLLSALDKIERKDLYLSAGCIRNTYWDFKYSTETNLEDVDVIFLGEGNEEELERELKTINPNYNWSVKNQARMHLKHDHEAYSSINEAISYWPEKATAVALKCNEDGLEIIAPYGLKDVFEGRISKSDKSSEEAFKFRLEKKKWLEKWPKLTIS